MKEKLFLLSLLFLDMLSWQCNSASNNYQDKERGDTTVKKAVPVYLFDSLEHFFGNENWQITKGTDTSYLLFSRQNSSHIKVYHYKMSKGDSVNNVVSNIQMKDDNVIWDRPGNKWVLQNASDKQIDWKMPADTVTISFRQAGKDKIIWLEGSKKINMNKTITLSDFLVRSRYDNTHGTNYASDTIIFNWRMKLKKEDEKKLINATGQ